MDGVGYERASKSIKIRRLKIRGLKKGPTNLCNPILEYLSILLQFVM
jgi:hypothetical protein